MNLLRSIAGQIWGAKTEISLTQYKTLTRSIVDFGEITNDSASSSQLKLIDEIQHQALKMCTGVPKFTNVAALQVKLNKTSTPLRRLQHQIEYVPKLQATDTPCFMIQLDHWTNYYGSFNKNSYI
jgi:hypothetical protein